MQALNVPLAATARRFSAEYLIFEMEDGWYCSQSFR